MNQLEYIIRLFTKSILKNDRRITFPRRKDNLGFVLYKFAGVFEFDHRNSSMEKGVILNRIESRIDLERTKA